MDKVVPFSIRNTHLLSLIEKKQDFVNFLFFKMMSSYSNGLFMYCIFDF